MKLLENFLSDMSTVLNMQNWGLTFLYVVTAIILPMFYIKQIRKYLNGGNGVGDLCFHTEIIQASLRVPALLYCISIANGPVFLSVFLDLIGRCAKLITAKIVHDKYSLRFSDEMKDGDIGVESEIILKKSNQIINYIERYDFEIPEPKTIQEIEAIVDEKNG